MDFVGSAGAAGSPFEPGFFHSQKSETKREPTACRERTNRSASSIPRQRWCTTTKTARILASRSKHRPVEVPVRLPVASALSHGWAGCTSLRSGCLIPTACCGSRAGLSPSFIYRCERLTRSPAGEILCIAHRAGGSGASGRFPVQFAGRLQAFVSGKSLNLGWMRFGRRTTKPDLTAAGSFDRLGTHTFNTEKGGG